MKAAKRSADLKKYAAITDVPDYGMYIGYVTADVVVLGLRRAGKHLTRQGGLDAIRSHGNYDGAGLFCAPVDLSLKATASSRNRTAATTSTRTTGSASC